MKIKRKCFQPKTLQIRTNFKGHIRILTKSATVVPSIKSPIVVTVFVRGLLLRGECVQAVRGGPSQLATGRAGQVLRGLCIQQEAGGAAVASEGGQRRGATRHLGLSCRLHLPAG